MTIVKFYIMFYYFSTPLLIIPGFASAPYKVRYIGALGNANVQFVVAMKLNSLCVVEPNCLLSLFVA